MIHLNRDTVSCSGLEYASITKNRQAVAHNNLRICYVDHGSAKWHIDDLKYKVSAGDIIMLCNRQKRCFSDFYGTDFKMYMINVKRQAFYNTEHLSFFFSMIKDKQIVFKNEDLLCLLKDAVREFQEKKLGYYEIMSAKLTEFFVIAERVFNFTREKAVRLDKDMIHILNYIDANIQNKLTLKSVCEMANMTESSFSRQFAKCNGISFKRYIISKRIEHAQYLLDNTDSNVIDIAIDSGFTSISGFYDAYRRITGTTPGKKISLI